MTLTLNGQDFVEAMSPFVYYNPPVITSLTPSIGPSQSISTIQITGRGFISTSLLAVKFAPPFGGTTGVSASSTVSSEMIRQAIFRSSTEIWVEAPRLSAQSSQSQLLTRIPVFVSNNMQVTVELSNSFATKAEQLSISLFAFACPC